RRARTSARGTSSGAPCARRSSPPPHACSRERLSSRRAADGGAAGVRPLALERQLGVARPLVPRPGVVACVVARAAQRERRERGSRAGVTVRDDLGAFGRADELADPLRRLGPAGTYEQRRHLDVLRSRDVPLTWVARAPATAVVLVVTADVEDRQRRIV